MTYYQGLRVWLFRLTHLLNQVHTKCWTKTDLCIDCLSVKTSVQKFEGLKCIQKQSLSERIV